MAKELIAGFAGAEVDRLFETKGGSCRLLPLTSASPVHLFACFALPPSTPTSNLVNLPSSSQSSYPFSSLSLYPDFHSSRLDRLHELTTQASTCTTRRKPSATRSNRRRPIYCPPKSRLTSRTQALQQSGQY